MSDADKFLQCWVLENVNATLYELMKVLSCLCSPRQLPPRCYYLAPDECRASRRRVGL
jgi:hypothetical protein